MAALVAMSIVGCSGAAYAPEKPKTIQDVQVFTTENKDGKVTTKTIEAAFDSVGLSVPGNNDMNKPFSKRFGKVHYKVYNLAMYVNNDLTFKLIEKYPSFGALTPLTMSIWSDGDTMNVSTLTINGMARAAGIPVNDPDLVAYAALITKALKTAMPNGHFKDLPYMPSHNAKALQVNFVADVELDEGASAEEFIEDFEAEFEGELEPLGFLLPNYTNVQEEIFDDHDYHAYDFYHTYSICKFDVIYPVSKLHPEAGAWAPCSFYLYKKKGENKMYMGFLSVDNWITTLDIKDQESIKPLKEAQGMIEKVVNELIE
jgi:uncharacterized protein (DUF302 family)